MIVSIWKNLQHLSAGKKSTSSFLFSLRYCKDIVNWLFLAIWACLATLTQSDTINLVENFCVYLQAKINFILHAIMKMLHRYVNLFWVLWACLVTLTQNDSITSQKTSMFIFMQKIKFIIQLFLTILHFKESCNLLGWQHLFHNLRPKILPDVLVKYQ